MTPSVFDGISARTYAELQSRVPALQPLDFAQAVSIYRVHRTRTLAKPKDARDKLDALADGALRLSVAIGEVMAADGIRDYLLNESASNGDHTFPLRLCDDLRTLAGLAENARRNAEKLATAGRGLSNRTRLIHRLAFALERAGQAIDAREGGALVLAFGIAMAETSELVADAKGTVKSALETYTGGQ